MHMIHTSSNSSRQATSDGGDQHSSQLRELAAVLEVVAELDNPSLIRSRLAECVGWLKGRADSIEHDEISLMEQVQNEYRAVERRLHAAEDLAATDFLTGLANRREAEKLMIQRIQAGQAFCILLFDLDDFKRVNDQHGHHVGDHVLKVFAKRLAAQFRPDDVACRWGGDEFLVVMSSAMPDALGKASEVARRLNGQYAIESSRGALNICVTVSVGVAQHEPGESGEQLFARADALLYLYKGERSSSDMPAHAHLAADAGGFTILIADDEARIRTLAGEVLRSHGYNVLQAADGVEALELAAQHPGPIHLLLTDLSMPRLDGRELHRRLKSVRPGTATLFMSGDLDTGLHQDAAFLPKPFATSVLVSKVNEALRTKTG
jgi:diguanylate cyclase (GGDEF)-like protein